MVTELNSEQGIDAGERMTTRFLRGTKTVGCVCLLALKSVRIFWMIDCSLIQNVVDSYVFLDLTLKSRLLMLPAWNNA